jgi:hypothetical protein
MTRRAILPALAAACGPQTPEPPPLQTDTSLFARKRAPKPGDWLDRFDEPGQTLRQYLDGTVNRKSEARATIYIRPLGDVLTRHPGVMEAMQEYAQLFYQTEARLLEAEPMPSEALEAARGQYNGDQKFLERSLKVMSHEMGHILSIRHCIEYECVMNGSNSLRETDEQPMHLCPTDLRKVVWNVGADARRRYDQLEAYYRARGFAAEAEFVGRARKALN